MFSSWFIVKTKPQSEQRATRELRRIGLRVYFPQRTIGRARKSGFRMRRKPLLTGYVLVRFPSDLVGVQGPEFGLVHQDPFVRDAVLGFVTGTDRQGGRSPIAVADQIVAEFMRRERAREFDDMATQRARRQNRWNSLRDSLKQGGEVRLTSGTFTDYLGTLERLDDRHGATVLVELFGRMTRVHVEHPEYALEPLGKAA